MRRIDRYWKRCAAGMMAALMLMTAGEGGFTSFAAQSLNSPSKIVISNTQTQEGNASALQSAPETTAAYGTVKTTVTDASSYFGAGRMTMLANHDTRAQQLAVIIENGAGGLIVVDGGWQENSAYVLEQIKQRGGQYPGGSCGLWGACGAAVSTGMFMSILTKATPLTGKSWRMSNEMTAKAFEEIAKLGGPRCCKRNSFTAVKVAAEYVRENMGIVMELPEKILCDFSAENKQCLKKHCPYNPGK